MDNPLCGAAEKCFRAAALEHLSYTQTYQLTNSYQVEQENKCVNVLELLDGLLLTSEAFSFVRPVIGDNEEILSFDEEQNYSECGKASFSMSLARSPITESTTVKGSTSSIPFFPGGFKEAFGNIMSNSDRENLEEDLNEIEMIRAKDYLCRPPFFTNDVILLDMHGNGEKCAVTESNSRFAQIFEENKETVAETKDASEKQKMNGEPEYDDIDVEKLSSSVTSSQPLTSQYVPQTTFAYAREMDASTCVHQYEEAKQRLVREYPFPLDPFQQAAVVCMENNESLFVAAHTSAGKTVVAEYAVALCKQHKTKAIYTSPIKALSNQKFRDFKAIFEDVGLITGDIQLYPEAFCLIMTTEILRSMLYNGSEVIRDLEWVIFDEVHYINNAERGHVWEEVLIMLPAHVKIVMLSATVPNCVEFADWVGRIKNRRINVIYTLKRPVPLEHFIYTGQDGKTKKDLFKIVDSNGEWIPNGYKQAQEAKALLKKNEINAKFSSNEKNGPNQLAKGKQGTEDKNVQRKAGTNYTHGKHDKNIYISLIDHLRTLDKLPMVIFVFSRKRCDENAQLLSSIDLTSNTEKGEVAKFFAECIDRLKGSDKRLPQVLQMRELCLRGFAVHHSGILPILKEVVELLFQQGLVKILFATETFAMGVNMPARTVVFDSITKHDGSAVRILNTGEYIQMAGRAGRRGLDTTGTVIVLAKGFNLPESGELNNVMRGAACRLESKFRVTYSMLLNLLRVEQLKVEDMLQRSYVESASLRNGLAKKTKLDESLQRLKDHKQLICDICEPTHSSEKPLRNFHNALVKFLTGRSSLFAKLSAESKEVDKLLSSGRVLILSHPTHCLENRVAVLLKEWITDSVKEFEVMIPCTFDESLADIDRKEIEMWRSLTDEEKIWLEETNWLNGTIKYGLEGVQPPGNYRFFRVMRVPLCSLVAIGARLLKIDAVAIANEARQREIPRYRNNPIEPSTAKVITELNFLAENWSTGGAQVKLPGIDINISQIELKDDVSQLILLRDSLLLPDKFPAKNCKYFVEHLQILRSQIKLEREISKLKYQLSADSLLLREDYQNRLKVLKALDFVKEGDMVSFKGRVACEIHHQELLITELILENKLHKRSTAEVAAMLSSTTCQYKASPEARFEKETIFYELKEDVENVRMRLDQVGQNMRVNIVDVGDDIRFDLMEAVYNWANGMPFSEIMAGTEAQEGLIVRCIQRLSEVCKDVRNAARIVGDPTLLEKMEQVSAAIKRDIVFAASLYTTV